MKFIVIDFNGCFSSVCNTKDEVFESVGYDVNEVEFDVLLEQIKGEYEVIEVSGDVKWLN